MRLFRILVAAALLLVSLFSAHMTWACSMCRGSDQMFFISNARWLPQGRWVLALETLYLNRSALHNHPFYHLHGPYSYSAPTVIQTQAQQGVQAVFNYGLTDRLMVGLSVPYLFNRFTQDRNDFRVSGVGDPELVLVWQMTGLFNNVVTLAASAGVRLPYGKTGAFDNYGFLLQPHDQIGSGAAAGILGLQCNYLNRLLPLFVSASLESNGTSSLNLRHGQVLRFNLATQRWLSGRLDAIAELNTRSAAYDKLGAENVPDSGGKIFYFSPGLRFKLGGGLALRGQAQIPVAEKLNGVRCDLSNFRLDSIFQYCHPAARRPSVVLLI
jgi:hypothetical protein